MASWDNELQQQLINAVKESSRDVTAPAIELLRHSIASIDGEPPPEGAAVEVRNPRAAQELAIRFVPIFLRSVPRPKHDPIRVFQLPHPPPPLLVTNFPFPNPPPH